LAARKGQIFDFDHGWNHSSKVFICCDLGGGCTKEPGTENDIQHFFFARLLTSWQQQLNYDLYGLSHTIQTIRKKII